ncbi:chloride channel protein [Melittangium boletus]|uniref:Chloride channel protein n=1 Tax=Melittangium boletus DSM 14713 TaxID=1294270 RepID=A0A250I9F1_9BACT|nr:chloride channel protein [Melittangium boletus]ATB28499.1 chloride channel protein [Melittangium boletus DSM 14713]
MKDEPPPVSRFAVREHLRRFTHASLQAFNRIRLPGPSVLPIAGAVVGLYAGLAAGIFSNLIGVIRGFAFNVVWLIDAVRNPGSRMLLSAWDMLITARWHLEYAIIGAPLAMGALVLARIIEPGGPRDEVKRRLRLLALLVLGALALYYPLVALTALNRVFGHAHNTTEVLAELPWWIFLLMPSLGGLVVGRLLRDYPDTHGHGLPEVIKAVKSNQELPGGFGLLKLVASAITIGSGGSAGREGPIVYGGAAFASTVGRTLGFSRRELAILLACGAGAGIAASFNAPIAGAVFAMEIILREFELRVFSPIILASVAGTLVGRGTVGTESMINRLGYQMVSGWEVICYVVLGLLCGLLAYAFVRLLHHSEDFFGGRGEGKLSTWLGQRTLSTRAGIGGLCAGVLAMLSPTVWGSGHDYINLAAIGHLSLIFLVTAFVVKLVATAITLGSGGSGGTFFPSALMGAMLGGAFGTIVHYLFPASTGPSGAYAIVGMGGAMAALTRGPLTGMMMLYELSGNHAIILPLMVTCTIASALCHYLIERKAPKQKTDAELLSTTPVSALMRELAPVPASMHLRPLMDQVITTESGTLPVLDGNGRLYGIVEVDQFREIWRDEGLYPVLVASDVARKVPLLSPDTDLAHALLLMDQEDVDALPVQGTPGSQTCGLLTRARVRRFLNSYHAGKQLIAHPVAPTEVTN